MLIRVAENGKKFDLDCGADTSVDVVQRSLASLTGVPTSEQMLICGDTRLETARSLGSYGLPADGRPIFLFNRARLLADALPPPLEDSEEVELELPPAPSALDVGHPLDSSPNPLLRALPTYERQFRYHKERAQAVWRASQARYDLCRNLYDEMEVQAAAIRTARGNMDIYYGHMRSRYLDFTRACSEQQRRHAEVLANFERDMARLRSCELHPALRTEQRRCLLDCVNEAGIRKWAEDCSVSHAQFAAKVAELRGQFAGLQRCVEELMMTAPEVDMEQLEYDLENHQKYLDEETTFLQSLSKDLVTVSKLVEECVGGEMSSSVRPLDAVAALDPMSEQHTKSHLPRVEACDSKLGDLLVKMKSCKAAMTRCVHMQLQSVAALQRRIRDMRNQLAGYKEAMQRQEEVFAELVLVRKVASAYHACMAEVVRRRAFSELYMHEANRLAEHMARAREAEVARREHFIQAQGLLPRDILEAMGLFGVPSQCEISIPSDDSRLLEVDEGDLQVLARTAFSGPEPGVPEDIKFGRRSRGSLEGSGTSGMVTSTGGSLNLGAVDEAGDDRQLDIRKEEVPKFDGDLELQNAWLRAEYAAAVAMLCSVEGPEQDSDSAKRLSEALLLKDRYTQQLQSTINQQKDQLEAYEGRIRELEGWVARQHASSAPTQSAEADVPPSPGSEPAGGSVVMHGTSPADPVQGQPEGKPLVAETPRGDQTMTEAVLGDSAASVLSEGGLQARVPEASEGGVEDPPKVLPEKAAAVVAAENSLQAAAAEVTQLKGQLDRNQSLLQECQVNCAHLENALHQAREEARTHLATAERRQKDYHSLRKASVRLHSLMQRLSRCLSVPPIQFPDTLVSLATSLEARVGDVEEGQGDSEMEWFQGAVRGLAEQVSCLAKEREELKAKVMAAEEAQRRCAKHRETANEQLIALTAKYERAVQLCKEKICFTSFNVQELAVFLPNAEGHYEAVNRNCPNHYLSPESVALFLQHQNNAQQYIIGQVVHIDHHVVKAPSKEGGSPGSSPAGSPPSTSGLAGSLDPEGATKQRWNPYGLPLGSEYAVVTIAMVPDLAAAPSSPRMPV